MKIKKVKSKQYLATLVIFLLVGFAVFAFLSKFNKTRAAWWDDSWAYRQTVALTNGSGTLQTDYQIQITLATNALYSAGKIQSDCDDLRVTDISGKPLSFWMEPGTCNNASTLIWVKISSLPTTGGTIYIYYGNPGAVSLSSPTNTFIKDITGLQGGWKLDEATWGTPNCSASVVSDYSGNSNSGAACPTTTGPTGGNTGKFGNGVTFDGSNDYLNMSNGSSLDITGSAITISAWVNPTSFGGGDRGRIVERGSGSTGYLFFLDNSNITSGLSFAVNNGDGAISSSSNSVVGTGSWQHVLVTHDGAIARFYVNGAAAGYGGHAYSIASSTNNFIVGARDTDTARNFNGSIDEVRVYNRVLTADEISDEASNYGYVTTNYANHELIRKRATTEPTAGSPSNEEKGTGPVVYWKFDEGTGTTLNNSVSNSYNGTLNGLINNPTWQTEDLCVSGKCLYFEGSNATVSATASIPNIQTVSFWAKPASSSGIIPFISLSSGTGTISITSSNLTLSAPGFTSPTYYVNGVATTTLVANQWNHIEITSGTAVTATNPVIGKAHTTFFKGFIDDFKFYNYARTAAQVKVDYAGAGIAKGATMSVSPQSVGISNGLVGYWKLDEATAIDAVDSSGNSMTGTTTGTSVIAGKFGNARSFTSTNQIAVGSISNVQTIAFWAYPTSTTTDIIRLKSSPATNITAASGTVTATGFTPTIYVNGVVSSTVTANSWQYIVMTSTSAITADAILFGRISAAMSGYLDEIRFYNRALTPSEVAQLYNWAPGPTGYWKMEEKTGTTMNDSSGNGIALTNYNVITIDSIFSDGFETGNFNNWTSSANSGTGSVAEVIGGAADTGSYGAHFHNNEATGGYGRAIKDFSYTATNKIYVTGRLYPNTVGTGGQLHVMSFYKGAPTYQNIVTVSYCADYVCGMSNSWGIGIRKKDGSETRVEFSTAITNSTWNTVKILIDESGTNPVYTVWIDGTQTATYTDTSTGSKYSPASLYVQTLEGNYTAAGDVYWDNVAMYDSDPDVSGEIARPVSSTTGKYGSASNFTGASYLDTTTTISGVQTVSFWAYPTSTTNYFVNLATGAYITASSGTLSATGFTTPAYYVNGVKTSTIIANAWQHIVVTSDAAISASAFEVGRANGSYIISGSKVDEVKIYNYVRNYKQITEDLNAGHPSGGSPVASQQDYWKFDEGQGYYATSSGIMASTATLSPSMAVSTGLSWWQQEGKYGKSIAVNGTNNYIDFGDLSYTKAVGTMSASFWVKPNALGTTQCLICKYNNTAGANSRTFGIETDSSTSTAIKLEFSTDGNTGIASAVTAANMLSVGSWTHIAMVYDSSGVANANILKLYVNGIQRSLTFTGTIPNLTQSNTVKVRAGGSSDGARFFSGLFDEVKFYTGALSAAEILVDYNRGSAIQLGSTGTASNSANMQYCIPGDASACSAPLGEWKMEEGYGATTNDTSGNTNDGAITSGTGGYVSGKFGKAYNFDKATTVINAASKSSLDDLPAITAEAWIYPKSGGENNYGMIVRKANAATPTNGWQFMVNSNYGFNFEVDHSGNDLYRYASNVSITANQWSHVAVTWDGSMTAANAHIYVNGKETSYATTTNGTTARVTDAAQNLLIGSSADGNYTFDGYIDEVKVYNYARTPAQITWDYNRGAPLVWLKFNECQGASANDSSGNGYTGTITITSGGGGTQDSVGTCTTASTAWGNGATGKYNASLNFDGTNDYIQFASPVLPNAAKTVSFWMKSSSAAADKCLFANNDGTTGKYGLSAYMNNCATGKIRFLHTFALSENYNYNICSSASVNDGTWHHIVNTWDGTAGATSARLYIDGKLDTNYNVTNTTTGTPTSNMRIAADSTASPLQYTFPGQIDDFQVYNYSLTQTQVRTLYNQGSAVRFGPLTGSP